MAFIAMYHLKITSNVMSLGGIAIAIGAMVDAIIVMIENAHKYIEREQEHPTGRSREKEYRWAPSFLRPAFKKLLGDCRKITWEELIDEMDSKFKFPGVTNAWTMPIKAM